jgi:molybdate transport system substrate-binding protein
MRRTILYLCAVFAGLSLLAALLWPHSAGPQRPGIGEVRVAAAADLKFALEEVVAAFRRERPDVTVKVTYGASGSFFAQLSNGAPFDVFLSADVEYPRKLIEQGLAGQESEFLYAVGHLVLWVPTSSALDVEKLGAKALLDPTVKKIAVANPRHAPYGRAAVAALKSLGVFDRVEGKLVYGENVAQAAQFARSGSADAGVFALSLALAPSLRDRGRYWGVPLTAHPRLDQRGVILNGAQDRESAEAFRAFLLGEEGKAVLKRYGFFLPGG